MEAALQVPPVKQRILAYTPEDTMWRMAPQLVDTRHAEGGHLGLPRPS